MSVPMPPNEKAKPKTLPERVDNLGGLGLLVSLFALMTRQSDQVELGIVASCTTMMSLTLVIWLIDEFLLAKVFWLVRIAIPVALCMAGDWALSTLLGSRDLALSAVGGYALLIGSVMLSMLSLFVQMLRVRGE